MQANELRQGYQQSGEVDEYSEFSKYGGFDDISPKAKIQANELKTRVPTKWRIRQICRIRPFVGTLLLIKLIHLNFELAKYRQINQICCIRRICHFVGTLVLSSFA